MGIAHVRALIGCAVALALALPAAAHEIGTTQVHALFRRNHTYEVRVITDRPTLDRKLLRAPDPARHVEVSFDPHPRVELVADGIRVTGSIPRGVTSFAWRYDLTYASYALTLENEGHGTTRQWLEGGQRSAPFNLAADVLPPSRLAVAQQYLVLGFTHIVPHGLDHILFVLGLFLLTTKMRPLLAQVTSFTIAHSITLGLTIYGVVSMSPRLVEPAIALSIAYVAIENLTTAELKPWRVGVVFCFGLLHGMGFAGVLRELGLPRADFATALVSFNAGVEAGQLTVIGCAFAAFAYWHRAKPWYRYRFVVPASVLIAATGLFWTVQRVMG